MKADMKTLLSKFPSEWMEFFALLCGKHKPLKQAELWYQNSKFSRLGRNVSWNLFLEACLETEPTIKEGDLVFQERILCLPENFVRLLLAFILHHKADTSKKKLAKLAVTIQNSDLNNDSVIGHLSTSILDFTKDSPDQINTQTQPLAATQMEVCTPDTTNRRPMSQPNTAEPLTKRIRLDLSQEIDHSPLDEIFMSPSNQEEEASKSEDALPPEILDSANNLLTAITASKDTGCHGGLVTFLSDCANEQVEAVCRHLDPDSLSEAAVANLSQLICQQKSLSFFCTVTIAKTILHKQLVRMDKAPSRLITGTFQMYGKRYPKQLCEGALVPYLQEAQCGAHQSDLIIKLCKETFTDEVVGEFLSSHFEDNPKKGPRSKWSDGLVSVLQYVADSKVTITEPCMEHILQDLQHNSFDQVKNLKFGKLLHAIVSKFGKQLTKSQIDRVAQINENHQTFMKKSIEKAIKKAR